MKELTVVSNVQVTGIYRVPDDYLGTNKADYNKYLAEKLKEAGLDDAVVKNTKVFERDIVEKKGKGKKK